jgi:transcriptional regulator with XRE-family HTH domain
MAIQEGIPAMMVQQWTGQEAKFLRLAMRLSIQGFACYLGLSSRAIDKWEARGPTLTPRHETQAILDTALARATDEQRKRFEASREGMKHSTCGCGCCRTVSTP